MVRVIQEEGFFDDGFAVGELTGRLKHQAPSQVKQWVSLEQLKDFKRVLRKYNYSITGISAHPSNASQILLSAEKTAEGTDPTMILAFSNGDRFMDGWEAGCLAGLLRYIQPEQVDEWVKVSNLEAIQSVMDEYGYVIQSLNLHPDYQKWTQLVAQRQSAA